jgi:hypothetical protein
VRLERDRAEPYALSATSDLAENLTNIRTASDVVRFVGSYGLLTRGPASSDLAEPFRFWKDTARGLRAIYGLHEALQRSLTDPRDSVALADLRNRVVPITRSLAAAQLEVIPVEDVQREASLAVAAAVIEGLAGVEERIAPASALIQEDGTSGPAGVYFLAPGAQDLVGAAYHELALLLVSRRPVRECEECSRVFAVRDQRQRFCSPRCSSRTRQRRFAHRQGADKGDTDGS